MASLPDGWLRDDEAAELARISLGRTVLELGAWKGRSTCVLAAGARYVVSVDRHEGIAEVGGKDSLAEYLANVRSLPNVAIVVACFEEFVPLLSHVVFDLVYVDGDHDAAAVARDTVLATSHAREMVAFHDWDFESVREPVRAAFGREPDALVGSLATYWVEV